MDQVVEALHQIILELFQKTNAIRTTIRIDLPEQGVSYDQPLAEVLAPGALSLMSLNINQRSVPTVKFLEETHRNLIQNDLENSEVPTAKELISVYGVRAQMLGPLIWNNQLIGNISVHHQSIRDWDENDIAALDQAKQSTMTILEQNNWLTDR